MRSWIKKHPLWTGYALFSLCCLCLFILFRLSASFSEWFATFPAKGVRLLLGGISSLFPFSLFELLVFLGILYLLFLIGYGLFLLCRKGAREKGRGRLIRLSSLALAILLGVGDLYVWTLAPSYFRRGVAEQMSLPVDEVGEEDVFFALESVFSVINECAPSLTKNEAGESVMPYSLGEMKKRVNKAATAFGEEYSFYQKEGFPAKSLVISPVMTYTHISGIYGFFAGEACINTNYPHFVVTATSAHELCHARGIAPENECNFLAAVILMESEDPYLRYCGAVSLAEELISVCQRLDRERTRELLSRADPVFFMDEEAYRRFFEPYRENPAATVSDSANSAYLKGMGQKEGTVSYSRVIRLSAAYFMKGRT